MAANMATDNIFFCFLITVMVNVIQAYSERWRTFLEFISIVSVVTVTIW